MKAASILSWNLTFQQSKRLSILTVSMTMGVQLHVPTSTAELQGRHTHMQGAWHCTAPLTSWYLMDNQVMYCVCKITQNYGSQHHEGSFNTVAYPHNAA